MKPEVTPQNLPFYANRRQFITNVSTAVGATVLAASPLFSNAGALLAPDQQSYTVGQIMDLFFKEIPGAPFPNTVDTLKSGSRDIVVTGVVTTMFATISVIRKAISLGANFIIAHEPTFYNHTDKTDWLKDSDVYQYKASLLKEHNIAVWRNHDSIHSMAKDGVMLGVLKELGWTNYTADKLYVINLPDSLTLGNIISHSKKRLHIEMVRYIGDLAQPCQKVLFLPGAAGGTDHITSIIKYQPDVLVCGELSEWETAEYVRDARAKGDKTALVVLGHIASEEPGSIFMIEWLKTHVPGVKATHVPPGNSLSFA